MQLPMISVSIPWFMATSAAMAGGCTAAWTSGFGLDQPASIQAFAALPGPAGPVLYASGNGSTIFERSGDEWVILGGGPIGEVRSLAVFDDGRGPALYSTPEGGIAADGPAKGVVRWNGEDWENIGGGLGGTSLGLTLEVGDLGDGEALYVGGQFQSAGGNPAMNIARWDGQSWSGLGAGSYTATAIHAIAFFDDGDGMALYAGGAAIAANGVTAPVARWDGETWTALPTATGGQVRAFAVHDDGSGPALYAAGLPAFGSLPLVERFDGRSWTTVGEPLNGNADALLSFDDGSGAGPRLYAGGTFTQKFVEGGKIDMPHLARLDGDSWTAVDGGTSGTIFALFGYEAEDGPSLLAGGFFQTVGAPVGGTPSQSIARLLGCDFITPCPADLDGSSMVESADLNILLGAFGCASGAGGCAGDVDGDGDTDSADLNAVLAVFGSSCG